MSNKQQREMNKTFTVLTNEYYSLDDRFRTFTKGKIEKEVQSEAMVIVNRHQQRYFDSPTFISLDDDIDIPVARCSNKIPATTAEQSLDETELSDLVFVNPNRVLSESMQVVTSRHPSLQDLKYISDVSSVLVVPPLLVQDDEEHIYQELIRIDHSMATPPMDHAHDIDENKENRPPLMPIKCRSSRIPVWTPSPKNNMDTPITTGKSKKHAGDKERMATVNRSSLSDLLDEWSRMLPKLKDLLSITRKMPLRMSQLSSNSVDFRRLKQLLSDMEMMSSSWTNAIGQCRAVLQHAQQQPRL